MRSLIVTWVLAMALLIRYSSGITVRLKYTTSDEKSQSPPEYVNITVVITDNTTAELRMQRVPYISLDTPVYTLTTDKDGRPIPYREFAVIPNNIGYYQDVQGYAALQIERIDGTTGNGTRLSLRGTFAHDGVVYTLSPTARAERDVSSQFEHFDLHEQKPHPVNGFDFVLPTEKDISLGEDTDFGQLKSIPLFTQPRRKRQSTPDYYIDVVAMVDFGCWKIFLAKAAGVRDDAIRNIQKYFALIFNGVDNLYQGINSASFRLNIRLNKIIICESSEASPFSNDSTTLAENYIDGHKSLDILAEFVKTNNATMFSPYDHVMLFIGYNLLNSDRSVDLLGVAFLGKTCQDDGNSASVIEEMGDYTSIDTAAHELGHSLSARHDGDENTCLNSDRYIMATSSIYKETPETLLNPWKFSNCSIYYFNTYINTLLQTGRGQQCLTTLLDKDPQIPETSDQRLGQLYPPSEQCAMKYGNDSYDCRARKTSEYCRFLTCSNPANDFCYYMYTFEGTSCGSGKLCKRGDCVIDAAAPTVDEDCVFGDEPRKIFSTVENKTCASLVQTSNRYCYQKYVFNFCCATCKSVKRNVPGCEYGDTYKGCTVSSCSIQENLAGCCETCNYTIPTTTAATTPPASSLATTTITISTTTSKSTAASTSSLTQTTGSTPPTQVSTASTSTAATASTSTAATVSTSNEAATVTTASPTANNTTTQRTTTTEAIVCVDTTGSVMDNMSCSDIAEKNIGYCYLATVRTQCCSTCGRAAGGVKGCEYGDREPTACALVNACQTTPEPCCQTCNSGRQTASVNSLSVVSAGFFLLVVHIVTPEW